MRWPVITGERHLVTSVSVKDTRGGSHLVAPGKATSESSFTHSAISYGAGPLCQAR